MAIAGVIAAAPVIISTAQQLSAAANKNDPGRLAANEAAYKAAIGGDKYALEFLKYRTGEYGQGPTSLPGWYSDPQGIGGWATVAARTDAKTKYSLASAAAAAGVTVSSGGSIGFSGGSTLQDKAQAVAQATGNTIVPFRMGDLVIMVIVGALFLWWLSRATKGR